LTVAAVDDDNLVDTATITVDPRSAPGQVGSTGTSSRRAGGGAPAASAPEIVVESIRTSSAPRLRLTVARRVTLARVRERGLRVMPAASRDVHVDVTVRRGTSVLTRAGSPPPTAPDTSRCVCPRRNCGRWPGGARPP